MENSEPKKKTGWIQSWWTRGIALFLAMAMACSIFLANAVQIQLGADGESASEQALSETTEYVQKNPMARAGDVITKFFTNPQTLEQYYQNASVLIGAAQYEQALNLINTCLTLANGSDTAMLDELWLKRGCLETLTKQYDAALESFTHISEGAFTAELLLIKAQIYDEKGDQEQTISALEAYLQLHPEDNDTRSTLAGILLEQENYDLAILQYDAILSNGGGANGETYMQRASAKLMTGYYEESIVDFLTAKDAGYVDPSACYAQCALASYLKEDYPSVISYGEQAIAIGSKNFTYETLYYYMGLAQLNLEAYDKAAELLTKSIDMGVDMVEAHYYRGACYMVNGNMQEAIADFTIMIDQNVTTLLSNSYFNRGVCEADLKDYAAAKSDLEKVLELEQKGDLYDSAKTMLDLLK
ncbi:MAG TPA: tetratricopeptide repeat protein [Candidatus Cryosericum sp.]|nr:tetratricopeptide repeat protein [Candidatus Cryosericum sp.]